MPVSVIARLFRKVTHQTCHSLNKHSPPHPPVCPPSPPIFNSPLMLSFKLPCQRSCPALRCQIKSFWLESRIARLIIMLIGQFSVFFLLPHARFRLIEISAFSASQSSNPTLVMLTKRPKVTEIRCVNVT